MGGPSIQIQTVLYDTDPQQLDRFLQGMEVACATAQRRGMAGDVCLVIGDCSAEPSVADAAALRGRWASPYTSFDYRFYGENLGSGGGHNRLFSMLQSDLALVCNPDTYASPRMLVELLAALSDGTVGVAEPRQVPLEQPKVHDPVTGDTSWASGSCLLVRQTVIADTGGFDPETFFLHCDDVDFSWRTKLAGWRVVHRPAAALFHDKRLSVSGQVEASDIEVVCGTEASVLLPWRYSRPDLVEQGFRNLEASTDPRHKEALARLLARREAGLVPEPLDPDHRVAQFIPPNFSYAVHRFW